MKKRFILSNKFLILFCIAFWMLMFFAIPSEASPKRYKGQRKQEIKFRENKSEMMSEQYRLFNLHPKKHYSKRSLTAKLRRSSWTR